MAKTPSPFLNDFTPSPVASTTPLTSKPGMYGTFAPVKLTVSPARV
jgi:hypothetical protein